MLSYISLLTIPVLTSLWLVPCSMPGQGSGFRHTSFYERSLLACDFTCSLSPSHSKVPPPEWLRDMLSSAHSELGIATEL